MENKSDGDTVIYGIHHSVLSCIRALCEEGSPLPDDIPFFSKPLQCPKHGRPPNARTMRYNIGSGKFADVIFDIFLHDIVCSTFLTACIHKPYPSPRIFYSLGGGSTEIQDNFPKVEKNSRFGKVSF